MEENQNWSAPGAGGTPLQSQANPSHRILMAEDDHLLLELNARVLSLSGYEVDMAADGAAAWRALSTGSYDLLITDNNMPELSGVELLRKLRAARMALPVIMATGTPAEAEFTRQPWLKPSATLFKPFTAEEMLRTVKQVLQAADNPQALPEPLPSWHSWASA